MMANGGTLVVRIDTVAFGPIKDSWSLDNIGGVAMIGGVPRPVRASTRHQSSPIDQAVIEQSNHYRVTQLVQALTFWLARHLLNPLAVDLTVRRGATLSLHARGRRCDRTRAWGVEGQSICLGGVQIGDCFRPRVSRNDERGLYPRRKRRNGRGGRLPDRPISWHPNLVTASGLEALATAMAEWRAAYNAAQQIEEAGERRRAVAAASREMRYFADRTEDCSGPSATDRVRRSRFWTSGDVQPRRREAPGLPT